MKLLKVFTLMATGAFFYGAIEVIGRGYTHISMGFLGGTALCMIHLLNSKEKNSVADLLTNAVVSAFFITSCELLTGEILNRAMGMDIWDYADLPYNFDGQICVMFSIIWFILSIFGILSDELIRRLIFQEHRQPLLFDELESDDIQPL